MSQKTVSEWLPRKYRNCLYASALSNLHGQHRNRLDDFTYHHVSDHFALFKNSETWILAFRGTDPGNDMRFLGVNILTSKQKQLPYEERTKILSPYCPVDAVLGCASTSDAHAIDTNLALAGGQSSRYNNGKGSDWAIDSSSDCWADKLIAYREEVNSRLHSLMVLKVREVLESLPKRVKTVYITGHSLGGNLAAFVSWNLRGSVRNKIHAVLFDPGYGPGRSMIGRLLHWLPLCKEPTIHTTFNAEFPKLVDGSSHSKVLTSGPHDLLPLPKRSEDWDIPILCFREITDAFSFMSVEVWPTINFILRGSQRYLGVKFHSICNFFTDREFKALTGDTCVNPDRLKYVESFEVTGNTDILR